MAESFRIDPELEAVLHEVAAQPGSILLKVPRPKLIASLFDGDPRLSTSAAGLSLAEREIVSVWREELAWLLREACLHAFMHAPPEDAVMIPYEDGGTPRPILGTEELQEHLNATSQSMPDAPARGSSTAMAESVPPCTAVTRANPWREIGQAEEEAQSALARFLTGTPGAKPSIVEMAALSHRLVPTQQARRLSAADLARGRAPWTALQVIRSVLKCPDSVRTAANALEIAGLAYSRIGDTRLTLRAYLQAADIDGRDLNRTLNLLVLHVQCGDKDAAMSTVAWLDGLVLDTHPSLVQFLSQQLAMRRLGGWTPSKSGAGLAMTIADHSSGAARRIMDAFLS